MIQFHIIIKIIICKKRLKRHKTYLQEKKAGKDTDGYRCSPGSAGCHKEALGQCSSLTEAKHLGLCSPVNSLWLPEASSSPNLILQCISGERCSFGPRVTPRVRYSCELQQPLKKFFRGCWSIVDSECCVSFWCTAERFLFLIYFFHYSFLQDVK